MRTLQLRKIKYWHNEFWDEIFWVDSKGREHSLYSGEKFRRLLNHTGWEKTYNPMASDQINFGPTGTEYNQDIKEKQDEFRVGINRSH